jgi:hypothetical protein
MEKKVRLGITLGTGNTDPDLSGSVSRTWVHLRQSTRSEEKPSPPVMTIGHSTHTLEEFIRLKRVVKPSRKRRVSEYKEVSYAKILGRI